MINVYFLLSWIRYETGVLYYRGNSPFQQSMFKLYRKYSSSLAIVV